jgi:hypothetical protein
MTAQLTRKQWWYEVDGPIGVEAIPEDLCGRLTLPDIDATGHTPIPEMLRQYCENREAWTIGRVFAYGVRSSLPGYMDCTGWTTYTRLREATKAYHAEQRACRGED